MSRDIERDMRRDLYVHLVDQPLTFFSKQPRRRFDGACDK
jgi:hypothetical protein